MDASRAEAQPLQRRQAVDAVELLLYRSLAVREIQMPAPDVQQLAQDLVTSLTPLLRPSDIVSGDEHRQVAERLADVERASVALNESLLAAQNEARRWRRRAGRAAWEALLQPPQPTSSVPTDGVVINDIGSMDDFLAAIDSTIRYFGSGDIVEGTVVQVGRDEVMLNIGYRTSGVIPRRELSIDSDLNADEVVSVGDQIEALVLKEDKDGRLILSEKRATKERRRAK